jgi:hypothetical protein
MCAAGAVICQGARCERGRSAKKAKFTGAGCNDRGWVHRERSRCNAARYSDLPYSIYGTRTLDIMPNACVCSEECEHCTWLPRSQTYAGIPVELRPDPTALRAHGTFAGRLALSKTARRVLGPGIASLSSPDIRPLSEQACVLTDIASLTIQRECPHSIDVFRHLTTACGRMLRAGASWRYQGWYGVTSASFVRRD